MRRLKWGVLGCSGFARRRSIPAMMQSKSTVLVAVASRSRERAESFSKHFSLSKAYDSYHDLLNDSEIEAVHIPLPNAMHCDWAVAALQNGKHVLVEKPFATSFDAAEAMVSLAQQKNLRIMEAFMWPFHPQHKKALELIEEGDLAPLKTGHS